jgi:hypothetical protein
VVSPFLAGSIPKPAIRQAIVDAGAKADAQEISVLFVRYLEEVRLV